MPAIDLLLARMKAFLKQVYLLQWKNVKLKQRNATLTVFEVISPLVSFLLLVLIRHSNAYHTKAPTCQFKPSPLASKGPLAALRAFCFLGVCRQGDQSFDADAGLLGDEDHRNLSRMVQFTNRWLTNPTIKTFTGALTTMPSNMSDPKQAKRIELGSMFRDKGSRLFDGVAATDKEQEAAKKASFAFPRRWDVSMDPMSKYSLTLLLANTDALPTLVCSVKDPDPGWLAVSAMCQQPTFRANLKSQFELDATLSQMNSADPNKYAMNIELRDVQSLAKLLFELNQLSRDGTLNVFRHILGPVSQLAAAGGGGGAPDGMGLMATLGPVSCGSGETVFSGLTGTARKALDSRPKSPSSPPPKAPKAGPNVTEEAKVAESSNATHGVSLTEIVPPEEFCFDKKYHDAMFGTSKWLMSKLGLQGLFNIMFGVIPYYPDVPNTRQFLLKVNRTLLGIGRTSFLAERFTQTDSPMIAQFITNSSRMAAIRAFLLACSGALGNQSSGPSCRSLATFLAPNPDAEPTDGSNSSDTDAGSGGLGSWRDLLRTADSLMYRLYYATACFRLNKLHGFDSVESLDNYTSFLIDEFGATENASKPRFVASVLFDSYTAGFVKYRLRFDENAVDSTRNFKVLDGRHKMEPRSKYPIDFKYFTSFFLHLQELLEHGIQAAITGVDAPLQSYLTMFPTPCYMQDKFAIVMGEFLPMIMTVSWIYNVALLVNAIVYEKETRLKEMMKIMGLSDGVHWVSWFLTSFVIMAIASVLMTLLLKVGQLIVYSNPLLLFFFILSFVVSTICEAFFISIFFSNSSVAAAFAGLIYFVCYLPMSVIDSFRDSMTMTQYLLSCLVPQLAFGVGCKFISFWELAAIGLQNDNFSKSPLSSGEFSFKLVIIMMWVDSAILMILTWYLEKVFPGAYGVPRPWYFPMMPSFWCSRCRAPLAVNADGGSNGNAPPSASSGSSRETSESNMDADGAGKNEYNAAHFEDEPRHLKVGVAVKNLSKVYNPGLCSCKKNAKPFTAVDNLSFNFYENHITSFLGHNGAGKSTTMSVLTGLYTPTTGTAFIAGYDIRTDMDEIRKHLGMCPQHNVLFDSLTVEDHIYFYGMLKGLSKADLEPQIDTFIADVGLQKKKFEISKNLSGGMKRKLSVAMAFVGDSKIIVLDEPTAGVDPHARRAIWDVLAKFRRGRTIILTTHHMDEADILGDRICIINKGRLVCSGSPMFLKKVFGEGYTLTLVKTSPACKPEAVLRLVQSEVPQASVGECTSSEINVKLPYNSVPKLSDLFARLDENLSKLKIDSYGIEDSTLEEIFLTVTDHSQGSESSSTESSSSAELGESQRLRPGQQQARNDGNEEGNKSNNGELESQSDDSLDQTQLRTTQRPIWQQVKALWLKRLHVLRRSKIGFLAEFILPAFFILLALALLQIVPRDGDSPPMELAPWYMLGKPERSRLKDMSVFKSRSLTGYPGNATLTDMANRLMLHINSTDFLGTRCIRPDLFSNADFPCKTQHRGSVWSAAPRNLPSNTSWCQCSYADYPNSAKCVDWPKPARKPLMSADVLESMQGYNLTNYIQSTVMEYYRLRFGGYTLFVNDTQPVSQDAASANFETQQLLRTLATLTDGNGTDKFLASVLAWLESSQQPTNLSSLVNQIWYDNRGYVSGPAYLNTLTNAVMRALASKSLGSPDEIGVSGWTHPITSRLTFVQNVLNANTVVAAMTVVSIIFALSFIPASFVLFLISERTTNAKHLQFVSGINPTLYWIVNHAWNMLNYLVPLAIVILLFVAFKNYEFVGSETIGPFLITMILFGFASAPLMYPFSWVMSVPSKAFTMLSCLNLGIGFTTTMAVSVVRMIGLEDNNQSMLRTADILKTIFLLLPHFCLGQSLMELNIYYQISVRLQALMEETGIGADKVKRYINAFEVHDSSWDATRRYLLCMAAHSIVYFGLVLLLEYNCCCKQGLMSSRFFRIFYRKAYEKALKQPDPSEVDDDVRAEAAKVEGGGGDHLLELRRLVKIFSTSSGPKAAVKGISLGVKSHECFGFLGVNGAGKTTTFQMLTGELVPTSGDAQVGGFSILTEALEVHKQLGYCPQFDALLPLLTGRETLQLYARIRGVEEADIDQLVETISSGVGIEAHLDKTTQEYSGGNKRKLSCGIAFIGNPTIVFLDEPTAGMDPGARRFLWRCIQRMVTNGSCVILTTHSMEDCQALCHRLTIMVNGRLQCIGSPQHLKNKFGQGFTIFLRVRPTGPTSEAAASTSAAAAAAAPTGAEAQLERVHGAFMSAFPDATLSENHASVLQYQLKQTVQLRTVFASVQRLKDDGLILDYSVNQTTLDQVFINFAKNQTEATAADDAKQRKEELQKID